MATVESVTNPLLGILGRLPPFVAASVDVEAEEGEGAQLILVDIIVIATISEARPPQSNAATSSFRHHFSLSLSLSFHFLNLSLSCDHRGFSISLLPSVSHLRVCQIGLGVHYIRPRIAPDVN